MVLDNVDNFLEIVLQKIEEKEIDFSNFDLDHIGYQSSSPEDYEKLKSEFLKIGKEVSEAVVGGRRVGIYKLSKPIKYKNYSIPAIELVEPKEGQTHPSALEHIELVIDTDFQTFVNKYPNIEFNTSKIDQPTFPMVTLDLGDNLQVKFHLKPVLDIVADKYQ